LIHFGKISKKEFLADYWQKKPLLIKQALPDFISPIEPDELAGLSLEEEFESRLITGSINQQWALTNGPFLATDFEKLAKNNWSLLVQGVDRFIPEIEALITHFDFIPRWRFDDVMISYAVTGGSVGPHFDLYDVFLLQGSGNRRWQLSTQNCNMDNYLPDTPLRIMQKFTPEQTFEVEAGDILYIPPKVAHHGVSLDDNCTTLSFGYRSYSAKEMFNNQHVNGYYQDPVWDTKNRPAFIPTSAIKMANELKNKEKNKIANITAIDFAKFATKLDILDKKILQQFEFEQQQLTLNINNSYQLHSVCKIAYMQLEGKILCFINGFLFDNNNIDDDSLINFCNKRVITAADNAVLLKRLFSLNLIQNI
jgi:50S ribosomal protein L16 3-hydroxylase